MRRPAPATPSRTDELDTIYFQVRSNPAERGSVFTVIFPRLPALPQREAA